MTTITLPADKFNNPIQAMGPGVTQTISFSGTSAATTNAMSKNTIIVRLIATQPCFVAFDTGTPTATTASLYLPAGIPEYFAVNGWETIKIAALQASSAGSLYVTEMV